MPVLARGGAVYRVPDHKDYVVLKLYGDKDSPDNPKNIARWIYERLTGPGIDRRFDKRGRVARRKGGSLVVSTKDIRADIPYICQIRFARSGPARILPANFELYHAMFVKRMYGESCITSRRGIDFITITGEAGCRLGRHVYGVQRDVKGVCLRIANLAEGKLEIVSLEDCQKLIR